MVKKDKKKDTTLDEILLSTESVNEIGVEQARSLSKAASYEKGVESIWGISAQGEKKEEYIPIEREEDKGVGGTESVPGTENVPINDSTGTESVPGTENVSGTESVPGTEKSGTKSVPGTEKSGTKSVPGTEKSGTKSVSGTESVPRTENVPGTENVSEAYNRLINRFSEIDRIYVIKRILALNVPHSARCLLLQMMTIMSDTKEEISLSALSREVNTRKATLIEALKNLEMEEIIGVQRRITGIVVDLSPFLGGTESVPGSSRMYVGLNNNIYKEHTYKQTIGGTKNVPPKNLFGQKVVQNNVEEILAAIDLLGIIKITGGKIVVSKKALKIVSSAALSDEEKTAVIALAKRATTQAKKNPQAYWIKIVEEKDRDELTENDLQEAKDFMRLCETFRYKSFEAPGLEDLKRLMSVLLKQTSTFKDRPSLVDYLQLKANELEERLEKYKSLMTQTLP